MRVLIAPDSFKGSLRSPEVAAALAEGVLLAAPGAEVIRLPLGDGGEGTLDALIAGTHGRSEFLRVSGPLGEPTTARFGLLGDGEALFVETAEAAGLSLLTVDQRNPLRSSTYGADELLRAAVDSGRRRILIGIGGSATNDGGAGLLQALGVRFVDADGHDLPPGGAALARLARILLPDALLPEDVEVIVACDVTNPLSGPDGASAIYGPQKGATPEMVATLDAALDHFADVAAETLGRDLRDSPGAGAAGGLGFALTAFLDARLERGVALILDALQFDEHVRNADLVLTGEGRIDRQTLEFGKTISGVAERAAKFGTPVLAIAGALAPDLGDYRSLGVQSVMSIVPRPMDLETAMAEAPTLIRDAARRVTEVFLAGRASATLSAAG